MELTSVKYGAVMDDLVAQAAEPGLLLVVPDTRRPANVMTIGWALFGRIWEQPMCLVMVRPSRYTHDLIDASGVFTVNRMPEGFDEAVLRCGSVSGRDVDKIAEQGWTLQSGETQPAPYLAEALLHLECRTAYTAKVTDSLSGRFISEFYAEGDYHTIYFGLVTGVFRHE
jgi:flavin reductase (DIM6/NTAB) family NADH-FMN oxidoreductase RutF